MGISNKRMDGWCVALVQLEPRKKQFYWLDMAERSTSTEARNDAMSCGRVDAMLKQKENETSS